MARRKSESGPLLSDHDTSPVSNTSQDPSNDTPSPPETSTASWILDDKQQQALARKEATVKDLIATLKPIDPFDPLEHISVEDADRYVHECKAIQRRLSALRRSFSPLKYEILHVTNASLPKSEAAAQVIHRALSFNHTLDEALHLVSHNARRWKQAFYFLKWQEALQSLDTSKDEIHNHLASYASAVSWTPPLITGHDDPSSSRPQDNIPALSALDSIRPALKRAATYLDRIIDVSDVPVPDKFLDWQESYEREIPLLYKTTREFISALRQQKEETDRFLHAIHSLEAQAQSILNDTNAALEQDAPSLDDCAALASRYQPISTESDSLARILANTLLAARQQLADDEDNFPAAQHEALPNTIPMPVHALVLDQSSRNAALAGHLQATFRAASDLLERTGTLLNRLRKVASATQEVKTNLEKLQRLETKLARMRDLGYGPAPSRPTASTAIRIIPGATPNQRVIYSDIASCIRVLQSHSRRNMSSSIPPSLFTNLKTTLKRVDEEHLNVLLSCLDLKPDDALPHTARLLLSQDPHQDSEIISTLRSVVSKHDSVAQWAQLVANSPKDSQVPALHLDNDVLLRTQYPPVQFANGLDVGDLADRMAAWDARIEEFIDRVLKEKKTSSPKKSTPQKAPLRKSTSQKSPPRTPQKSTPTPQKSTPHRTSLQVTPQNSPHKSPMEPYSPLIVTPTKMSTPRKTKTPPRDSHASTAARSKKVTAPQPSISHKSPSSTSQSSETSLDSEPVKKQDEISLLRLHVDSVKEQPLGVQRDLLTSALHRVKELINAHGETEQLRTLSLKIQDALVLLDVEEELNARPVTPQRSNAGAGASNDHPGDGSLDDTRLIAPREPSPDWAHAGLSFMGEIAAIRQDCAAFEATLDGVCDAGAAVRDSAARGSEHRITSKSARKQRSFADVSPFAPQKSEDVLEAKRQYVRRSTSLAAQLSGNQGDIHVDTGAPVSTALVGMQSYHLSKLTPLYRQVDRIDQELSAHVARMHELKIVGGNTARWATAVHDIESAQLKLEFTRSSLDAVQKALNERVLKAQLFADMARLQRTFDDLQTRRRAWLYRIESGACDNISILTIARENTQEVMEYLAALDMNEFRTSWEAMSGSERSDSRFARDFAALSERHEQLSRIWLELAHTLVELNKNIKNKGGVYSPPRPRHRTLFHVDPTRDLDMRVATCIISTQASDSLNIEPDTADPRASSDAGHYWIGNKRYYCRVLPSQTVMVRVGGGWQDLAEFLKSPRK